MRDDFFLCGDGKLGSNAIFLPRRPHILVIIFSSTVYLLFEHRRLHGDFILAYHVFHGCLEFPQAEMFKAPAERDFRGHDFMLRHRSFRLFRRKAVFSL